MTEIIDFPGGRERFQIEVEKIIDDSLNISNSNVKECIKKRVSETLAKYQSVPAFKVSVSLSISEADERKLVEALSSEYRDKVSGYARALITEICILHAKLCKAEYGI